MKPVSTVRGRMMPLDRSEVDTDQIMPKQFLTRVERTGYGNYVFHEWRQEPNFVFNNPQFRDANVLVTGPNFGSGSSREHAVWGLQQYGFEAVIAPSFSDIFVGNSTQMGLLTVRLPEARCRELMSAATKQPSTEVTIDLPQQTVACRGVTDSFDIDDVVRDTLLRGLDEVDQILTQATDIAEYERHRPTWLPTTTPIARHTTQP